MLLRQAMPTGVPAWQPWVGLTGVLVFAAATVWALSRIFRVAILMHGKSAAAGGNGPLGNEGLNGSNAADGGPCPLSPLITVGQVQRQRPP